MFLELPELNPLPFPRLSSVEYCGSISADLLQFLTRHSPLLSSLSVSCSSSVLDPTCLKFCHLQTKHSLQSLQLELVVATSGATFVKEIKKIIETSPNLTTIGSKGFKSLALNVFSFSGNCDSWGNVMATDIDLLKSWVRKRNYDVQIKH